MRFSSLVCLGLLTGLILGTTAPSVSAEPPEGFKSLFNGKNLDGWFAWAIHSKGASPADMAKLTDEERKQKFDEFMAEAKNHWTVENGELVNDGKGPYLASEQMMGDYELLIEYKTVPKADSGIYLKTVPQVQIWDFTEDDPRGLGKAFGSGGLWNNSKGAPGKDPLVLADKPLGEWNKFRIIQAGSRTTIYLNDKLVVDNAIHENYWNRKLPLPLTGPILLQTHGGEIRWRNIFYRELSDTEANEFLRSRDSDKFQSVFDGKSLDGWAGAVDDYEIKDGAIVCKPKKGGNLFTDKVYSDFVARVEYQLPPGGNNGLAIRYPGKGGPSQMGMCEVQVLDDTATKYAKLDPRQYNGSVYGMIPATTGYLRPLGQWNLMEVTVVGHKIKVELNGNVILDGDVSEVTEFKDDTKHPGRLLLEGHFGFCGHNDPVAFKNISIQPLK